MCLYFDPALLYGENTTTALSPVWWLRIITSPSYKRVRKLTSHHHHNTHEKIVSPNMD